MLINFWMPAWYNSVAEYYFYDIDNHILRKYYVLLAISKKYILKIFGL